MNDGAFVELVLEMLYSEGQIPAHVSPIHAFYLQGILVLQDIPSSRHQV
jgi:hypothetical protein